MVYDFPEPVWPYAKTQALKPSKAVLRTSNPKSWNIWSGSESKTQHSQMQICKWKTKYKREWANAHTPCPVTHMWHFLYSWNRKSSHMRRPSFCPPPHHLMQVEAVKVRFEKIYIFVFPSSFFYYYLFKIKKHCGVPQIWILDNWPY